jgi:predicted TIM-barrel fold metal-dependent hydrolase
VAAGIVGNADLMLGDAVEPVLEALSEAGKGRFRGIRCTAAWDASPEITTARANSAGMLADAEFRKGLSCLERMGLTFDCIVYHPQLPEVADMARAFPDLTIVLNHVGRPLGIGPYAGRREELMPEWRAGIDAVAECPNVVMKVGGLGNPISGFDWHTRSFPPGSREIAASGAPYYLYSIEKFGADRCMFESNFPVDKQSCSYVVCWNAFKRLTREFSASEQADLFHNTAARAYKLPEV